MKAVFVRDTDYAPCCFLLCKLDEQGRSHPHDGATAIIIDSDWDHPALAARFGWSNPCTCGASDGTIDCPNCGITALEMITSATEYLRRCANDGITSTDVDEYFNRQRQPLT